jgi:hypothetical protein
LIFACALVLAHAGAAQAQIINPFGVNNNTNLTSDDYKFGRAALDTLLAEPPAIGRYEDWSNPASGNKGKLTIISIFTKNGMPCRKVKSYIVYRKKGAAPSTLVLDVCETPAGWKIAS